ncbi:hypothetical protein BDN71DRAFT_1434060 [Pleurotus eryngii]|uniref:Uncharacterized protein n=1 Tax=Pleurotus eryngii TaxID=5323 RepID=A0A9P5ZT41_PLEER|nr:hypothetical protein BDN71DRAFT_1434060 [Pleurotus eryngii]
MSRGQQNPVKLKVFKPMLLRALQSTKPNDFANSARKSHLRDMWSEENYAYHLGVTAMSLSNMLTQPIREMLSAEPGVLKEYIDTRKELISQIDAAVFSLKHVAPEIRKQNRQTRKTLISTCIQSRLMKLGYTKKETLLVEYRAHGRAAPLTEQEWVQMRSSPEVAIQKRTGRSPKAVKLPEDQGESESSRGEEGGEDNNGDEGEEGDEDEEGNEDGKDSDKEQDGDEHTERDNNGVNSQSDDDKDDSEEAVSSNRAGEGVSASIDVDLKLMDMENGARDHEHASSPAGEKNATIQAAMLSTTAGHPDQCSDAGGTNENSKSGVITRNTCLKAGCYVVHSNECIGETDSGTESTDSWIDMEPIPMEREFTGHPVDLPGEESDEEPDDRPGGSFKRKPLKRARTRSESASQQDTQEEDWNLVEIN